MEIFYTKFSRQDGHEAGILLLNYVLREKYGVLKPEITVENKKPVLKNRKIHFSISHKKGLAAIGFNDFPLGFDVEFMRIVNLEKFAKRYRREFKTERDFFKFWTRYEAKIKLQAEPKFYRTFEGAKGYIFSIASFKEIPFPKIGFIDLFNGV